MEGHLIDVVMEDDTVQLARVIKESNNFLKIKYFSMKEFEDKIIYKIYDTCDEIDKECVSGWYDTDNLSELNIEPYGKNTWIKHIDVSDYEPTDDESSDDESVVDSEDFTDDEM